MREREKRKAKGDTLEENREKTRRVSNDHLTPPQCPPLSSC